MCIRDRPRRLTPYLECHIGGSFATDREANGGFYLSPSIGAQFKVNRKFKLNLMAGYELQKLERTKKQEDPYLNTTVTILKYILKKGFIPLE